MKCPNCSWSGSSGELIHTTDLIHRLSPGDTVPDGECPECGALFSGQDDVKEELVSVLESIVRLTEISDVWLPISWKEEAIAVIAKAKGSR